MALGHERDSSSPRRMGVCGPAFPAGSRLACKISSEIGTCILDSGAEADHVVWGTFLSTLCYEVFRHLDFHDSWHSRGFSERAAAHGNTAEATVRGGSSGRPLAFEWPRTNRGAQSASWVATPILMSCSFKSPNREKTVTKTCSTS